MNDLEKQEMIENLPSYLKDLALEVQDKNDEYEKVKAQLTALKTASDTLKIKVDATVNQITDDVQKVNKIKAYITNNPQESEENYEQIAPVFETLIKRIKTNKQLLKEIKIENEVIIQDIMIFSEDEVKLKQELEELNNTLKINLDFSLQNNMIS